MNTIINHTYGKTRKYTEIKSLPEIGNEWIGRGYEDAIVRDIVNMNDTVAATTNGDPKEICNFYKIIINMDDDDFIEYVVIRKEGD